MSSIGAVLAAGSGVATFMTAGVVTMYARHASRLVTRRSSHGARLILEVSFPDGHRQRLVDEADPASVAARKAVGEAMDHLEAV